MEKFKKTLEDVKKLSGSKRERADSVASKLVFMSEEMEILQGKLKEHGWTECYKNGENQFGTKKSADADAYLSLVKNYNTTMKLLNEMLASVPDAVDATEAKYF